MDPEGTPPTRWNRWTRLGLEAAAVLLGILTAFAIDAGWARHQAVQDERATLERVLAEFESNRPELEVVGDSHQKVHEWGVQLLRIGYGVGEPTDESLEHLRILLGMSRYFDPSTGALDRFLSTGQPGYVASPELMDRLAGYPARVDELWQQQRLLRDLIATQIDPYVIASADRLALLPPAVASASMHSLRREVSGPGEAELLRSLMSRAEVRNLVATRVVLEAQAFQKYEMVAAEFEVIVEGLRAALRGEGAS